MTDENSQTEVNDTAEAVETPVKPDQNQKQMNIRDHEDTIRALRKENADTRKKLEELSAAKAEELANKRLEELRASVEEAANKSADDKLAKALAERDQQARERQVKLELRAAAKEAGVADFVDLWKVSGDHVLKAVEFTDDGEVANASQLISELKQKKPHLFVQANTSSNAAEPAARMQTNVDYRQASQDEFIAQLKARGVRIPGLT